MPLPPLVEPVATLTDAERARTARHLSLAGLGETGQRRLAAAHVAVVGAGGLGSPVVLALAAAGIGTLTIIDDDVVELSNLQRQVVHRREDAGSLKVDSAVRAAAALSDTLVRPVAERLTADNATALLADADLVIDGSDLFDTRVAVAAATEELGIPLVWGTVQEFDAQVTVFWSAPPAGHGPVVLSDLYPAGSVGALPTCAEVGVLGALCLQVGSLLALEAIKLVAGIGEPLLGRVLVIDGLRSRQTEVPLRGATAATKAAPPPQPRPITAVGPGALGDTLVIDVREAHEVANGMIPGAVHLPLAQLLADPAAVRGPVVIVCQTAVRSRRAAEALRDAGVEASILAGGMEAWTASTAVRTAEATA
ncbi:ThiF family adenylyltransferase [Microbacterium sp. RU33B]|uniref:ThiF family adenylyltransferase n=1 Tax=Microbacterium sp. RU33B TaxID=1907390 RepID=UPI0009647623|nr:ThiF family adenylyltransferase [Microbacterium sp. RU33B]SIT68848.1 adenylyltransferase and sulfurtransferase [Microbacterium sp. RU33B]